MRRLLQRIIALILFAVGVLVVVVAFVPFQYPDWWPNLGVVLPTVPVPWWPVVTGIGAGSHYSARVFLSIAVGLIIFLPQVETTFVSLMRRQSPIGSPYVDRKDFTCPTCGTVNRPSVQFCVKCGTQIQSMTRHWAGTGRVGGRASALRGMLWVLAIVAFFLGIFDLTLYSTIVAFFGADVGTVLAATVLSFVPSIAAYVALKDGPFRKYGSLKRFDKLVFGSAIWVVFGVLFLGLAILIVLGPGVFLLGTAVVLGLQVLAGVLFLLHPVLRRSTSGPVTMTYS